MFIKCNSAKTASYLLQIVCRSIAGCLQVICRLFAARDPYLDFFSDSLHFPINFCGSKKGATDGPADGWTDQPMDRLTDGRILKTNSYIYHLVSSKLTLILYIQLNLIIFHSFIQIISGHVPFEKGRKIQDCSYKISCHQFPSWLSTDC